EGEGGRASQAAAGAGGVGGRGGIGVAAVEANRVGRDQRAERAHVERLVVAGFAAPADAVSRAGCLPGEELEPQVLARALAPLAVPRSHRHADLPLEGPEGPPSTAPA